ncbi:MAG: PAS domain S-box protein, partial [Rhodospirillaceae bacterium]
MMPPPFPTNEAERLAALDGLSILDTKAEERFDRVTRIAKAYFGVPIALVSLVDTDRQWFKSRQGLEASETPRNISFCGHAILNENIFVVDDAKESPIFCDNPLVVNFPNICFYAGAPLHSPDGYRVGTLCIISQQRRTVTADDLKVLRDLADCVESELALVYIRKIEREEATTNYKGQIEAINRSQMIIEFTLDGSIIKANANYLKAFGYAEGDLAGKNHSVFVSEDYKASAEYREFWAGLRAGKFQSGEFERIGKDGRYIWIEASYNPIIGPDGKPAKVIKIATDVTDKVCIRRAFKDTQARLRAIIDNVLDGIITIDTKGTIATINPAVVRLFGYDDSELIGQNIKILMPEPNRSNHDRYLAEYHSKKGSQAIGVERQLEGLTKDGQTFPIELTVTEVDLNGERLFVGLIRDITERKNNESLQASFSAIIESSTDAIMSKTLDGIVTSWNPAAEMLFGYTASEMIGTPMLRLFPPDRECEEQEILEKIRRGANIEHFGTFRKKKNGEIFPISVTISPIRDNTGTITGAVKIARDITERKKFEKALAESERKTRRILETSNDGFWMIFGDTRIVEVNPAMCKILGRDRENILNRSILDFVDDRNRDIFLNQIEERKKGLNSTYEIELQCADGSAVPCLFSATPMHDDAGIQVGSFAMVTDITERKQAEVVMLRAKEAAEAASKTKADFLANMSHEIRTPMNAIIGMTHLAQRTDPTPKQKNYLTKIDSAAQSLIGIINDILDFSKIEAGKLELERIPFSLDEVLTNLADI